MGEVRKVQRTASGTFFVCIPKPWAESHGLKRGSVVSFTETSNGKLLIDPEYGMEPSARAATIKPSPYLGREVVGKYLLGFDIIRVEAKNRISFEMREVIKKTVDRLIGLEIVEENHSNIILQCLLDPSGFPPEKILRRGYAIATGMHRDVINALLDGDVRLAKSVIARDDEVNRLYFLLVRILRTIIQNPSLSEKVGVRSIECLDYRLAASLVEAIADECVRAATKTIELKTMKLSKDLVKIFAKLHTACFEAHESALRAFFMGDTRLAERVRNARPAIEKTFTDIESFARAQSLDVVPQIVAVASILKQVYEHSVDIADLVMPRRT